MTTRDSIYDNKISNKHNGSNRIFYLKKSQLKMISGKIFHIS